MPYMSVRLRAGLVGTFIAMGLYGSWLTSRDSIGMCRAVTAEGVAVSFCTRPQ